MTASCNFLVLHDFPEPEIERTWREFLGRVELPSHYCAPEFFKEPFWCGKSLFAVLALNQRDVVGVVTGIHEGNELQCGLPARPQICIDSASDLGPMLNALVEGLLTEAGCAKLLTIFSWDLLEPLKRHGFRACTLEGDVVLDLRPGPETLFKQFHRSCRRNIRLAIREGVSVTAVSTPQDILASYDVYLQWRQTKRKKVTGKRLAFSTVEQAYGLRTNRRIFLASHTGTAIAALWVRFCKGGLIESSATHSIEEYLPFYPNELLNWKAIEWACHEGFRSFSFGGAHAFLRRFGGDVVPIHRYRLDRTWFRRHELQESICNWGRDLLRRMPEPVERKVRRVLIRG